MSVPGLLFFILQAALGFLVVEFVDDKRRLTSLERLSVSLALGLGASALVLLLLLLFTRSWQTALPLTWFTVGSAGLIGLWRFSRLRERPAFAELTRPRLLVLGAALAILLVWLLILWSAWHLNAQGLPEAVTLGWGDAAYHKAMIERLRVATPFTLEHPVLAGETLRYPLLINLTSALYERLGFSETLAWHLPLWAFAASMLCLLFCWGRRVLGDASLAVVLILLVLFGSGLGFAWYVKDLASAFGADGVAGAARALLQPPGEYTNTRGAGNPPVVWIVPIVSFFAHQRSFVAGTALALAVFVMLWAYRDQSRARRWGIVWGLLPLWHTHTFLAAGLLLLAWALTKHVSWRNWLGGQLLGGVIALPQLFLLSPAGTAETFLSLKAGWLVDGQPFWFWTKNFGVLFWLWVSTLGAFMLTTAFRQERWGVWRRALAPWVAASVLIFVAANVIQFQPWAFDNNKVLFYWWLTAAAAILTSAKYLIAGFPGASYLFALLVVASVLSGLVDVQRRLTAEDFAGYYSGETLTLAAWARKETQPNDRFLTASTPPPVLTMLTGRPVYLGYGGWLWSQGYGTIAHVRQERIKALLVAGSPEPICNDGVRYVLWDQNLQREYPEANRKHMRAITDVAFGYEQGEVLKLKCPST